ncbi:MAG: DUF1501 domain-containing protein [Bdellovibrionales bacterium]|nr:DUF1501 domain-containing protein [Bdellovibrionales bacterium]
MMKAQKLDRRSFLKVAAVGTCGSLIHNVLTPGFAVRALAAPLSRAYSANPLLIVVNLSGGASYQLAPIYHSAWRDKNPNVSYGPEESLPLTSEQGIHPSLTLIRDLYQDGDAILFNKVGFANHSRSHSTAAEMWMTGHASPMSKAGMLNQLSCQMNGLFSAISLAGDDPIFEGSCSGARRLESLATLSGQRFKNSDDETAWIDLTREEITALSSAPTNPNQQFARNAISSMDSAAQTIRDIAGNPLPDTGVPFNQTGFGNDCRDAARVIQAAGVIGTHAIYLERGGFDTHSNERNSMPNSLTDVNNGLSALVAVIKSLGRWNDTTIVIHSEFARTFENGSRGTDHGGPSPVYVMGGTVAGGRIGSPTPSNNEIASASGFLRGESVDARNLYYQIISGMGYNPAPIFTETFDRTNLGIYS